MGALWDAAVVGGGPAGAAAARTLARAGCRVLLVDREAADGARRVKPGETLPPAAGRLLRDMGVEGRFLADGHLRSVGNQSAWGGPELVTHDFLRDPDGCGWHLDRRRFDATLRRAAAEAGAVCWRGTRVHQVMANGAGWSLDLVAYGARRMADCRWLIDASGRGGALAGSLGAERVTYDRMVAFTALYRPADAAAPEDPDAMTLLESTADGWWYTARLPGRRRVVVFHTDADLEAARRARCLPGFEALLAEARQISARLGAGGWQLDPASLRGAPAASQRRAPFAGRRWLAAGDAAIAFDPLSSQGILTALYGGLKAGRAVHSALMADSEVACRAATDAYSRDLQKVFEHYLHHRRTYYRAEQRWADQPFWRRRCRGAMAA